jgi:putative transposase
MFHSSTASNGSYRVFGLLLRGVWFELLERVSRRPRLLLPGAIYHVMTRGNRKAAIFDGDDDRQAFLDVVAEATSRFEVACFAYCLMGNHYHLVLATPRGNLSQTMRYVNGVYSQTSNRRHARTGHLFGDRFKSLIVETERYLQDLVKYVALNPVRAGLANDPSLWEWSSHRATAGLVPCPAFLDLDWIDWAFGGASRGEAQLNYRLFVNDPAAAGSSVDIEALTLGSLSFNEAVRDNIESSCLSGRVARAHRSLGRPTLEQLFCVVGSTSARAHAIRDAHVRFGYSLAEIGSFLGLHPRTPSMILRRLKAASE